VSDAAVHEYWFGRTPAEQAEKAKLWFGGGPEIDAEIRTRFGDLVEQARTGKLDAWAAAPRTWITWLILVDQFSRNLYRNSSEAFACDAKALAWSRDGIARGLYAQLSSAEKMFALLPFEHAEDLEAQKTCCVMATELALSDLEHFDQHKLGIEWARKHLDVIARFGRFPHRNAVLGRESTKAELDYLAFSKQAKQWL
jgi:uncharacterized protein (DUF924 family)